MGGLITFLAVNLPKLDTDGPDRLQALLRLFFIAFGLGAVISILGYAIPSKTMQIVGIVLIFGSTAVFMGAIGVYG